MPTETLTALLSDLYQDKHLFIDAWQVDQMEVEQFTLRIQYISRILEQAPYSLIKEAIIQYIQSDKRTMQTTLNQLAVHIDNFIILSMVRLELSIQKELTIFFHNYIRYPTNAAYKEKIELVTSTFQTAYPSLFDDSMIIPSTSPICHAASSSFSSQGISPTCDVNSPLVAVTTPYQEEEAVGNASFNDSQSYAFFASPTPPVDDESSLTLK